MQLASVSPFSCADTHVDSCFRFLQEQTGGDPDMPSSTKLDAVLSTLDDIRGYMHIVCDGELRSGIIKGLVIKDCRPRHAERVRRDDTCAEGI